MILDLSSVLACAGESISFERDIPASDFFDSKSGYQVITPVSVSGTVTNIGDAFLIKLTGHAVLGVVCARCVKGFNKELDFSLDETVSVTEKNLDNISLNGNSLDITDLLYSAFVSSIEFKYVCSEDCKGLCPICGADLNETDCGCTEDETDPRFEVLRQLLDNNE